MNRNIDYLTYSEDRKYRIIVIEDDEGLNRIIQKVIVRAGHEPFSALTGNEAILKTTGSDDEILLVDYELPDMNAHQLIEEVTKKYSKVPAFIVMTGYGDVQQAVKMMQKGAKDYLVKDFGFIETISKKLINTIEDIEKDRKLKITERELKKSELRFQNLFSKIMNGFAIHKVIRDENRRIYDYVTLDVNPAYERLLGVKREFVIGKKASEILPEEELKKWLEIFSPIFTTEESVRYETYSIHNGKYFDGLAFVTDEDNFSVVFSDVTKRKKAEEQLLAVNQQLEASEQQLRASIQQLTASEQQLRANESELRRSKETAESYLNISAEIILTLNTKGEIILLNDSGYKLLEYKKGELWGKNWFEYCIPVEMKGKINVFFNKMIGGYIGGNRTFETEIITKSGNRKIILWHNTLLKDESGEPYGTLSSGEDITGRKNAERERHKQNLFLNAIIDKSPVAMWIADKDGRINRVNKALLKNLDLPANSITGKYNVLKDQNFVGKKLNKKLEKVFKEKKVTRFSTQWFGNRSGYANLSASKNPWIDATLFPILNKEGRLINVVCQWMDITVRKKAEIALAENERVFHNLFNHLNSGVAIYEVVDNGRDFIFKYVNKAAERIDRQSKEELIGKSIFEMRPNIEEFGLIDTFRKVLDTRRPQRHPVKIYEDYVLKGYYENYVFLLPSGEMVAVFDDITERIKFESDLKEAKEKAEESDFRLKLAVDSGKLGIWDRDLQKNRMVWNNRMFELYGISEDKFTGTVESWINGLHPDDRQRAVNESNSALYSNKEFNTQFRVLRPDNTVIYVKADGIVIRDRNDKPVRMIGINRDITEIVDYEDKLIQAKEKAEEADKLKTAFLANMSHEIRTPMNGILGFTGLLQERDLNGEDQQKYIQIIQKSGERLLNTVNDIIEISKIETGQTRLYLNVVDIYTHILTLYEFFSLEAEKKGLKLEFDNRLTHNELVIQTDINKLSSVISNLVKNAIKFTEKGTISIGITTKTDFIEFFVKDTGIGIPENRIEAIFNRFEQADIGDSRVFEGSGLGLAISKSYVQMLGGKIWVESEVNKGSTFYFTLPYNSQQTKVAGVEKTKLSEMTEKVKLKVLIAEDDEVSKVHLNIVLKDIASEIVHVGTGVEAVEMMKNRPDFDIILMDIKMPEMSGFEATGKIREFNKSVVIIAQTAFALEGDRRSALEAGCNDYISKPILKKELLSLIEKYF